MQTSFIPFMQSEAVAQLGSLSCCQAGWGLVGFVTLQLSEAPSTEASLLCGLYVTPCDLVSTGTL